MQNKLQCKSIHKVDLARRYALNEFKNIGIAGFCAMSVFSLQGLMTHSQPKLTKSPLNPIPKSIALMPLSAFSIPYALWYYLKEIPNHSTQGMLINIFAKNFIPYEGLEIFKPKNPPLESKNLAELQKDLENKGFVLNYIENPNHLFILKEYLGALSQDLLYKAPITSSLAKSIEILENLLSKDFLSPKDYALIQESLKGIETNNAMAMYNKENAPLLYGKIALNIMLDTMS